MKKILFTGVIIFSLIFAGCSNDPKSKDSKKSQTVMEKLETAVEGEENATQIAKCEIFDETMDGTHLELRYDEESNTFVGSVENTTDELIESVRVEVHLSNGVALDTSEAMDLKPGAKMDVQLYAGDQAFETWLADVEAGNMEHNNEGSEAELMHEGESEHSHSEGEKHEHK